MSCSKMGAMSTGGVRAEFGGPEHRIEPPPFVTLIVNGTPRSVPATGSLLSALRGELGLTGAKPGCGEGACGSCTVLVEGETVRACRQDIIELAGRSVTTIEGLATGGRLHPVQRAFVEVGAAQCGYCTPGMVLSVVALLARHPDPDDDAVNEALSGNLCRCGAYTRIREAVHRAAELIAEPQATDNLPVASAADDWKSPDPRLPGPRPGRPWDMTEPEDRDWFEVLGDGLVVVLRPRTPAPGTWATDGGAWLHVGCGGTVTAFTGKVDVGQDNRTALRLLVAEELRIPLESVRLAMGDTDLCPYDMGTFGSRSMPDAGRALSRVAAHAALLIGIAVARRVTKSRGRHWRARGDAAIEVARRRDAARTAGDQRRRHGCPAVRLGPDTSWRVARCCTATARVRSGASSARHQCTRSPYRRRRRPRRRGDRRRRSRRGDGPVGHDRNGGGVGASGGAIGGGPRSVPSLASRGGGRRLERAIPP